MIDIDSAKCEEGIATTTYEHLYHCPVCGYVGDEALYLVSEGPYCLSCLANWIKNNVPVLEKAKKTTNRGE